MYICIKGVKHRLSIKIRRGITRFINDEKGEMLGTIGWMAMMTTILVLVHGLISGWLPGFINRIFDRMDMLV